MNATALPDIFSGFIQQAGLSLSVFFRNSIFSFRSNESNMSEVIPIAIRVKLQAMSEGKFSAYFSYLISYICY
jgi:hypothetical protein